jgi:hypothetical protein
MLRAYRKARVSTVALVAVPVTAERQLHHPNDDNYIAPL